MITPYDNNPAWVWSVFENKLIARLRFSPKADNMRTGALAFSADGRQVASSGEDKRVIVWRVPK